MCTCFGFVHLSVSPGHLPHPVQNPAHLQTSRQSYFGHQGHFADRGLGHSSLLPWQTKGQNCFFVFHYHEVINIKIYRRVLHSFSPLDIYCRSWMKYKPTVSMNEIEMKDSLFCPTSPEFCIIAQEDTNLLNQKHHKGFFERLIHHLPKSGLFHTVQAFQVILIRQKALTDLLEVGLTQSL